MVLQIGSVPPLTVKLMQVGFSGVLTNWQAEL